jgi:hypothetical protein
MTFFPSPEGDQSQENDPVNLLTNLGLPVSFLASQQAKGAEGEGKISPPPVSP